MLGIIRDLLQEIIDKIDTGNSNMTEEQMIETIDIIKRYSDKEEKLSRYQAAQYLNVDLKVFDRYVKSGQIKPGKKVIGFKEKFYLKSDLDDFIKETQK